MKLIKGECYFIALTFLCLASTIKSQDESDEAVVTEEIDDAIPEEEIIYNSPEPSGNVYFSEHFDDIGRFKQKWVISEAKKDDMDEDIAKYEGKWSVEPPVKDGLKGDQGLVLKSKAKHSAISARLSRPFVFADKPLIIQYEVQFQEGQDCGGAYLKFLSEDRLSADLKKFNDKTPYTIMFGPDKCGTDVKLHFIFRHRNPNNGSVSEKHCKKPKERIEDPYRDKRPHLYSLHIQPDNTFSIYLDQKVVKEGNLLEDFTPSVNPPAEIDDPSDKKPEDWDEREKIPDPEAQKPDDWDEDAPATIPDDSAVRPDGWLEDEPEMIPDPNADKPEDWDSDMDGEWEAPLIANPLCEEAPGCGPWKRPQISNPAHKGKWRPPLIDNPNYKGKWKPRRIANPDYFEDLHPFKMTTIVGLGFELWSMSDSILFDNIIVTDDAVVADKWASDSYKLKVKKIDKDAESPEDFSYTSGWWAVYFVYVFIPIAAYIWYLWKRVAEESLFMKLVHYTNDHPWLWAVYVIVIGLPIVMLFVFCCGPTSKEKADMKRAAEAKKTDAVQPDDIEDDAKSHFPKPPPASKSDLEVPEETGPAGANEQDVGEKAEHDEDDDDDDDDDDDEPPQLQEIPPQGDGDAPRSPKKVRSRKE